MPALRDAAMVLHLLLLMGLLPASVPGLKILLVPSNYNSHVLCFTQLAVELAKLGHETELIAASNARKPGGLVTDAATAALNFTYITYPVDEEFPFMDSPQAKSAVVDMALSDSLVRRLWIMMGLGMEVLRRTEADCARMLENDVLMDRTRSRGFQFAIMDPIFVIHCYYSLPYSLGIPYASMSVPYSASLLFRNPRLPSFSSPHVPTDRMSFFQRLQSTVFDFLLDVNSSTHYVDRHAPGRPALTALELVQRSTFWFYLEDVAVSYPGPQMPNTVAVADLMAGRPGRPLPDDLESFLSSSASSPVAVVSFGSVVDRLPDDIALKFCDAFRRTHADAGLRVIWRMGDATPCGSEAGSYLRALPWIPQNDLLADRRVRLFVTHGGLNSVVEAASHGVPMIVFPLAFDQPTSAAVVESRGFGVRMELATFTVDELVTNIRLVLDDATYRRNAERASAIMRDRRVSAAERVSDAIEHIVRYGDSHLRSGAVELNVFQFLMVDVFLVVVVVVVLLSAVVVCVVRCCCRKCVRVMGKFWKTKCD